MSTHARPLADRLAAASDAQLEQLLRRRGVRPDVDWDDFFDAAEALLEPGSIERGLKALTRDEARLLHDIVDGTRQGDPRVADADIPEDLALIDAPGRAPVPVAAQVHDLPAVPDAPPTAAPPASDAVSARAAERAFTTVGGLADLLLATRSTPLTLVATGTLSASERRRFGEGDDLDQLRVLAELAGLARPVDRRLRITTAADEWLAASFAPRWARLAAAFRDALPAGIRVGDGWVPVAAWPHAHPWDTAWPARAAQLADLARRLGLLAEDGSEPEWAAGLRTGFEIDTTPLEALLPTEVDRLFLQNDLTAIAPGPLQPALDNRLRAMTEHESAAQASSYRFTADSIAPVSVTCRRPRLSTIFAGSPPSVQRISKTSLAIFPEISPEATRSISPPSCSGDTGLVSTVRPSLLRRPNSSLITQFAACLPSRPAATASK